MRFFLITYDSLHVRPGETLKSSYPLFWETSGNGSILRDKSEQEIVDWLFLGPASTELTQFVYNPIENGEFLDWMTEDKLDVFSCAVTDKLTDSKNVPGDIDLMIIPTSNPKFTTAVQCKRVKVKVRVNEADKINKLTELTGASKQCKLTANIGFARTYLLLVVSVDAVHSQTANVISRDASEVTWQSIGDELRKCDIPSHVGIIIVSATQMTGKNPNNQSGIAFGLFRPAEYQEQSSELTARIVQYAIMNSN